MPSGPQLEALVRRFDRALTGVEADAIRRLTAALRLALTRLEADLRRLYGAALADAASASSIAVREARARLLIAQVRSMLDITAGTPADDTFTALVRRSYQLGADNALSTLTLYEANVVTLSSTVRADVLVRATNASARLARHGREFAETAERLIIDGITRGRGWGRVAAELRRETGATRTQAEMIVRTESIAASTDARKETYKANGVEMGQWFATADVRVCGYCAARAGQVYHLEDVFIPAHPACRCYVAPYRPEWREMGLVDVDWAREHHAESLARSDDKARRGPSPFEAASGRTEAPTPVWTL